MEKIFKKIIELFYKNKSENDYIKKSFFLGIIYYKKNLQNYDKEMRVFGLPFWKKKVKQGYEKFYLFGAVYFKKSSHKLLYDAVLGKIDEKYKHIYINFNCSGETYLFLSYINPPENSVFVATKKYHMDLCRMMHPQIDCIYLPNLASLRVIDDVYQETYKKKHFFNILPFQHFIKLENELRTGQNIHYCKEICNTMGIDYSTTVKLPVIPEETKSHTFKKAERISLNLDNFVFLCPESQSNKKPKDNFWVDLTNKLHAEGYDVFINQLQLNPDFGIGKTCYLTFDEAYYLASVSKKIIGLRSGFIEMLTSIKNVPITCYYTDFKNRGKLKSVDAETVLKGFTLKKLPNVNTDLIMEEIIE